MALYLGCDISTPEGHSMPRALLHGVGCVRRTKGEGGVAQGAGGVLCAPAFWLRAGHLLTRATRSSAMGVRH